MESPRYLGDVVVERWVQTGSISCYFGSRRGWDRESIVCLVFLFTEGPRSSRLERVSRA